MISSVSSSPTPFEMSSVGASTRATTPGGSETMNPSKTSTPFEEEDLERRHARLSALLDKAALYSSMLKERMDDAKRKAASTHSKNLPVARTKPKGRGARAKPQRGRGTKRLRAQDNESSDEDDVSLAKRQKLQDGQVLPLEGRDESNSARFQQPALVTGAKLKDYQLEGVEWMISLDQNGISGILADEMGLGKTLQTIAFNAYLREQENTQPFLIVCPLSVLHNWIEEFKKFAPTIPVCMYHGTPAERAELRRTVMRRPSKKAKKIPKKKKSGTEPEIQRGRGSEAAKPAGGLRRSSRFTRADKLNDDGEDDEDMEDEVEVDDENSDDTIDTMDSDSDGESGNGEAASFPVIVTTYEMIIKDRVHLTPYNWGYIVVDEGHRLKNLDCKLMQEIKKYSSAGRMILTGTPLHNNLAELWSLLNFILPDIFDDIDSFQQWFNLPSMQTNLPSSQSSQIIHSLHAILKPFLLRRLKVDVEANLPPKKEYLLYAPLSIRQREIYDSIVGGGLRAFLMGNKGAEVEKKPVDVDGPRKLRSKGKKGRKSYVDDDDDDVYFERLESGELESRATANEKSIEEIGREHQYKATAKQVNNMKLQNAVMQLRKVCSHPFLFDWPVDPSTHQPILNEDLVDASGKMMVLDRLLDELFKRGHKVLLFSQFTTMLDIIEDWACEFKGWNICRIDGSTSPMDRREEMNKFQNGGDAPDAPCLFLLSTRAGGLGINLVAADTVIFYDQDWNPQMDAQAQDRAHRIGQTRPVLIFRLLSAHTIETKIMQRATEKRKLEALVIAKGKFKMPSTAAGRGKPETMAEMAASLLRLEGEKIDVVPNTKAGKASVLSDDDLEMLLDRRPEVFADRGKGWTSTGEIGLHDADGKKTAFAVYDAPADEGNDALAHMLGEDVE